MLDSHELNSVMQGMTGISLPIDQDEVLIGGHEDIEPQAHAGTGGSSKIKSRPANASRL